MATGSMVIRARIWSMGLLVLAAMGCASTEFGMHEGTGSDRFAEILGEPAEFGDTLFLSDEIKAALDERINPRWNQAARLRELRTFLFDESEMNIRYDANGTLTAMELWEKRAGNCLAMTNLFVAAARHVGLDAHFQTVVVRPTWDHEGMTMIRYEHIIAVGTLNNSQEYVVDFLPEFVLGDKRARKVTDRHALALYYNNLGAEGIINRDHDTAIHNLRIALRLHENFSDAWNNMGAAQRRSGRVDLAELSYRRALQLDSGNHSALSNLAQLYASEGRNREAQQYMERVDRYRARNPYFHYFIARYYFDQGRFEDAIQMLERSIKLKREEPEFYEALANTHVRLGNESRGEYYRSRAEQLRSEVFKPPARSQNHRFWIQTISVN